MNVAEWILVVLLSVTLLIFLVTAIVLTIKLIFLADEAKKIVATGQGIATKADDIIDNVKGMTSVRGIVKTFADRVITNQERRYAAEDAARAAAAKEADFAAQEAQNAAEEAQTARAKAARSSAAASRASEKAKTEAAKARTAHSAARGAKK